MELSNESKENSSALWNKVVNHRFVSELGEGTLDARAFNTYFDQDYLFLRDWVILLSMASAKSQSFDSARQTVGFLHLGLGGEEGLFRKAFVERGLSDADVLRIQYNQTSLAYSGYLRKWAYEGSFLEVIAVLLAVEWPYLIWAKRLINEGKHPENYYYQTWIDIHASDEMLGFVNWMIATLDNADITQKEILNVKQIFHDVLRYEVMFFDMAYEEESWPVR